MVHTFKVYFASVTGLSLVLFALTVATLLTMGCATGSRPTTLCVRDRSRSEVMGNPVGHETAARRVVKARTTCSQ